jgi:acyl carrier protein
LDQSNKLVPKGVYGEICVGGDGLSRGYLNNENLTKDRFIKNPFHKNERLYKTGDLGRWLEDGDVQFLSRKDSQVKIRGFRVELKEIEAALLKCRDITEVAVVMKSDSKNEAYLIAYYVTDHHITGAQLRSSLMMTLPEYMIPGSFQRMESMPLTVNGKLDYTKLPAVVDQGLNDEESVILPKTYIQKMLATIWEEILGTSVAGINQNFFELGGHSLKAAQLVARIQKDLNCVIGFRDVFINPTIESLSVTMRKLGYSQYEQIQASGNQDSYDMSHAQQRLWIIDQVEDDNTAYHVAATYELIGDFDQNAMNQSFNELIERHESLRTTFPLIDGKPRQKILNTANISVEFSDWSKEEIDESVIRDRVLCEVMKAFDLEHDALIRPKVIKVGTGRYIFTLTLHHIISDGVSLQILFKELIYFYNAYQSGRHPELTPLRIQYKDYSAWHNRFIMSDHASAQRDFWMQRFADPIPPLNLPADKSRPKTKTYTSDAIEFRLEKPLVLLLRESSQKNGATMFMCLQALVKTLLYVYTEQVDITTGTLTAGREHPDLVDQIGFYVNTLSIRTILKRNDTFEDVLQRVKEDTIAAYDNQLYPFDLILADLAANGVTVNNPFFEVLVTYEKKTREIEAEDLIGLAISKYQLERSVCHFDLDFNFVETGDSVDIYLAYNLDIYKRERIIEITHRFAKIAAAVMNRPDSFIHTLIERNTVENQLMEILRSIDGALLSDANDDNMFELKLSTSSVAELCNQVNSTFGINIFASDINFITSYTQLVSYISRLVPAKQSDVAANRFARPNRKVHEIECRG